MGNTPAHKPRKRFGQHFLVDPAVIDKIVYSINPEPDEHLIEIGPGQGAMTIPLLEQQCRLDVIELDRDLIKSLQDKQSRFPKLTVFHTDALNLNVSDHTSDRIRIIGNLPYNISSPLLFHLFDQCSYISEMIFMLQKEVVERICADTNSKHYSRLSVMTRFYCDVAHLFDIDPDAFSPPPKVMSSMIRLRPKTRPADIDETIFSRLVQQAFGQRRKILRNNLGHWFSDEDFQHINIDPGLRPQVITLEQYMDLTRLLMTEPNRIGA